MEAKEFTLGESAIDGANVLASDGGYGGLIVGILAGVCFTWGIKRYVEWRRSGR